MIKKLGLVAASLGMVLMPLAGTASAKTLDAKPVADTAAPAVAALSCGSGYKCDDADPGTFSFDRTDTDADRNDPGCATLQLRSGRNSGYWYAWARLQVASGCGLYQGWIDRSYDGGKTWQQWLGLFQTYGSNYGNMYYWPNTATIRACAVRTNGGKTICTSWH